MDKEKRRGGHAIMMSVTLPESIKKVRDHWVSRDIESRSPAPDAHLTLAFVGRDMDRIVGNHMTAAAMAVVERGFIPKLIHFTGSYSMYGRGRTVMVALVERQQSLIQARSEIVRELNIRGLPVDTRFGFSPHVTLGMSTTRAWPPNPTAVIKHAKVEGIHVKIGSSDAEAVRINLE